MAATRGREQLFFTAMAIIATVLVFAGFAPTYYLRSWFGTPGLTPLVHLHGAVFTGWIALFALQVWLAGSGRMRLHRRVGVAGAVIALLVVLFGVTTAITSARLGHTPDPSIPPLVFLAIPLFNIAAFTLLTGSALQLRRDPQAHKRLMLLGTITILTPAIARLPFAFIQAGGPPVFFALTDLLVLACVLYDGISRGKVHQAFWRGALVIVLFSQVTCLAVAQTPAWIAFARWLTS